MAKLSLGAYTTPFLVYVVVVGVIASFKFFLPANYIFPAASALMLMAPLVMRSDLPGLKWSTKGVAIGIAVSILILVIYLVVINKTFDPSKVSISLVLIHLLLVALPEEVFFRGYLQEKIGNNLKGIVIVSVLFAIAHIATRCLGVACGGGTYIEALLIFFPSLVMGYMYAYTGTLWANIIFHFLSNIVYIATGGL